MEQVDKLNYNLAYTVENIKSGDSRNVRMYVTEADIIKIRSTLGFITTIKFNDPDEKVEEYIAGIPDLWNIRTSSNNASLYLQPNIPEQKTQTQSLSETGEQVNEVILPTKENNDYWRTNLIVQTNKHTYQFDLNVEDSPNYNYYFVYLQYGTKAQYRAKKEAERQAIVLAKAKEQKAREQAKAQAIIDNEKSKVSTLPKVGNLNYSISVGKNSSSIRPTYAYDDGKRTVLIFSANQTLPSVYVKKTAKSGESKVQVSTRPDKAGNVTVIIAGTRFHSIVLRKGDQVVEIKRN